MPVNKDGLQLVIDFHLGKFLTSYKYYLKPFSSVSILNNKN